MLRMLFDLRKNWFGNTFEFHYDPKSKLSQSPQNCHSPCRLDKVASGQTSQVLWEGSRFFLSRESAMTGEKSYHSKYHSGSILLPVWLNKGLTFGRESIQRHWTIRYIAGTKHTIPKLYVISNQWWSFNLPMIILGTKQNGFVFGLGKWFIWNWHKCRIGRRYITRGTSGSESGCSSLWEPLASGFTGPGFGVCSGMGTASTGCVLFDRRLITVDFYRNIPNCLVRSWYWKTPLVISLFSWDVGWILGHTFGFTTGEVPDVFRCTAIETTHVGDPDGVIILLGTITLAGPCHWPGKLPLPSLQNMTWSPGCNTPREGLDLRR